MSWTEEAEQGAHPYCDQQGGNQGPLELLEHIRAQRYVFAIGSNEEAARLSGINVDNWKVAVYTLSGFFVGMSGIMYAAAYTTITPGRWQIHSVQI